MAPPTEFKMTPEQDDLDQVERELRFHPCACERPAALTADDVDRFNRDGFLTGIRIFSPEEIVEYRDYFDRLLARVLAAGDDSYSISTAHLAYGKVYDLLCHARIVSYVVDLLGENIIGWGSHLFCKLPHDGKTVAWHQDASYWPLTPSKAVTVWLAIDDADRDNACMRFIPGSHRSGYQAHERSSPNQQNVLGTAVDDLGRFGQPVDIELAAGEISIHSDLLLHGSEANRSDRRRCGLTLRYCAADVRAYLGWNAKGVVVAGNDRDGHWTNPPRPKND